MADSAPETPTASSNSPIKSSSATMTPAQLHDQLDMYMHCASSTIESTPDKANTDEMAERVLLHALHTARKHGINIKGMLLPDDLKDKKGSGPNVPDSDPFAPSAPANAEGQQNVAVRSRSAGLLTELTASKADAGNAGNAGPSDANAGNAAPPDANAGNAPPSNDPPARPLTEEEREEQLRESDRQQAYKDGYKLGVVGWSAEVDKKEMKRVAGRLAMKLVHTPFTGGGKGHKGSKVMSVSEAVTLTRFICTKMMGKPGVERLHFFIRDYPRHLKKGTENVADMALLAASDPNQPEAMSAVLESFARVSRSQVNKNVTAILDVLDMYEFMQNYNHVVATILVPGTPINEYAVKRLGPGGVGIDKSKRAHELIEWAIGKDTDIRNTVKRGYVLEIWVDKFGIGIMGLLWTTAMRELLDMGWGSQSFPYVIGRIKAYLPILSDACDALAKHVVAPAMERKPLTACLIPPGGTSKLIGKLQGTAPLRSKGTAGDGDESDESDE